VRLGQFDSLVHHAHPALGGRRQHHLGAEEPHQPTPLDAEALGHRDHQRVALLGADHGQADAGVAAGCLDDGLAGLQFAGFFRCFDDAKRQTVLHRTERIESLDLDEKIDIWRGQLANFDNRRVADRFKNVGVSASHRLAESRLCLYPS
jgi:hypothetical protein